MRTITFQIIIILNVLHENNSISQNLVPNGDFEIHDKLIPNLHNSSDNIYYLKNWNHISWQTFYCNCTIKKTDHDHAISVCDFNKYNAQSGCGMVRIIYEEACPNDDDQDVSGSRKTKGCTGYLKSKLSEPLEVGEVYQVSMWVYLIKDSSMEENLANHIGFMLSNKDVQMSGNKMLDLKTYFSDTIIPGQWCKISKYIRPECNLNYLVLGVFRDHKFPLLHRTDNFYYQFAFIDNVSIIKLKEDTLNKKNVIIPHCRNLEDDTRDYIQPILDKRIVYFQSGDASLQETYKKSLDSLFQLLNNLKARVYKIVGHTDNIGEENCTLSMRRADSVKAYIMQTHGLNEYNLITFGKCENDPIKSNELEEGRSKNRRAEISETALTINSSLYRLGLYYNNMGNYGKSREYFLRWLNIAPKKEWICILFDTRLQKIKGNIIDPAIYTAIRKRYFNVYRNEKSFVLDSMYFEDQKYRTLDQYLGGITGYIKDLDTFSFPSLEVSDSINLNQDARNIQFVSKYFLRNSLPKISTVGYRSAMGLALIMNHSQDTTLIKKYLPVLKSYCTEGESDWLWYAQLMDIYLLKTDRPQMFGTQYLYVNANELESRLARSLPISEINANRRSIALPDIEK